MMTREQIEAAVAPLQRVAAALAQASSEMARGGQPALDAEQLADHVEDLILMVLQDPRHRARLLHGLALRANRARGLLGRMLSGDTAHQPADVILEVANLAAAIQRLDDLLADDREGREAA